MSNPESIKVEEQVSIKQIIFSIKEFFQFLLGKWKILLIAGFIGALLGLGFAYMQKVYYISSLSFALEDEKGGGGLSGALGLASSFGFDLGTNAGGAFSGANLIELMKSRKLVEQALLSPVTIENENITLVELFIRFKGWREKWKKKPELDKKFQFPVGLNRAKFTLQQDSLLGEIYGSVLLKNLNVAQKDKKISIITIGCTSENETFSKNFVEVLAKVVSDFYVDTKSKKAKINLDLLTRQTDSIRNELNNAITGVAVANDNTYNLNPALNVKRTPSARRQVDVQANTAILTELVKNLELARVTVRKETPLIQIIDKPILPLKKEKTSKLYSLLFGGFLFGFLAVFFLIFKKLWIKIMAT